jgi:NAD-dependent deacetylase
MEQNEKIQQLAEWIDHSSYLVIFTGAGVSTESGISDFRSPGGIWERFDVNEFTYQKYLASEENRKQSWALSKETWPVINQALPNQGHQAIADLFAMGKAKVVITQNIDDLHQKSGIPPEKVIELHGTSKFVYCIECRNRYTREEIQGWLEGSSAVPECEKCGGILKSGTIAFGEPMPVKEVEMAEDYVMNADLLIVVGSSLVVYPAAQLPITAKRHGAKLVIVNMSTTPHDAYADLTIHGKAGDILPAVVKLVKEKQ